MGQSSFLKGIFRHNAIIWAVILVPLIAWATVIPDNTTIVGTTTMQSDVTISTANGIDINPGSDTNVDLLSVGVTGSPKLSWSESEDAFKFLNNLLLGTNASLTQTVHGSSRVSSFTIDQDSSGDPKGLSIIGHNSTDPTSGNISIYRSRGTHASPTIVQDDDIISRIVGLGYDGAEWENAAEIAFQVNGTPGTGSMPGEIVFKTTADGSTILGEALRINSKGALGIKTSSIDSSLIFDMTSVTYGSRPAPRMSQTQRDGIISPATGLMVYNNDFSKYNFYNGSAFEAMLTDIGTQEMSGKTVTDSLKFKETGGGSNYTAFQAPSSLTGDVTFTLPDGDGSAGQALKTDGAGTLSWGTAGGGAGGVTYHADFECDDTTKVSPYADSGATPTDGTGGSPNVTVTLDSSTPLSLTGSYKLTKDAANRQGQGWAVNSDTLSYLEATGGQLLWVSFNYKTSANYVNNDVTLYGYRVGSNTLEALNMFQGSSLTNGLPAAPTGGNYTGWITASSSDTSLRVILHQATTNASAVDILIDRLTIGPSAKVQSVIQSVEKDDSANFSFSNLGTVSGKSVWSWRDGEQLQVRGVVTAGTTVASTLSVDFSAYSINTTNFTSTYTKVGSAVLQANASGGIFSSNNFYVVFVDNGQPNKLFFANSGGSNTLVKTNGNTAASGEKFSFEFSIPIVGWSSGNLMSTNELNVRNPKARAYRSSTQSIASASETTVVFNAESYDPLNAFDTSSGKFTAPFKGTFSYKSVLYVNSITSGEVVTILAYKNTSTLVNNKFSRASAGSDLMFGISDSVELNAGETLEIKIDSSADTAYEIISGANASYFTIEGIPDLTVIGVNGVNELKESTADLATYSTTAGNYGDLTSLTLTPGTWDLTAYCLFYANGIVTTSYVNCGISTTSGNSTTGLTRGSNWPFGSMETASGGSRELIIPRYTVTPTSSTIYYLKGAALTSITNLQVTYKLTARRIQ